MEETQFKFYETIAVATLLYGNECLVTNKRQDRRVQEAKVRSRRAVIVYSNTAILC